MRLFERSDKGLVMITVFSKKKAGDPFFWEARGSQVHQQAHLSESYSPEIQELVTGPAVIHTKHYNSQGNSLVHITHFYILNHPLELGC